MGQVDCCAHPPVKRHRLARPARRGEAQPTLLGQGGHPRMGDAGAMDLAGSPPALHGLVAAGALLAAMAALVARRLLGAPRVVPPAEAPAAPPGRGDDSDEVDPKPARTPARTLGRRPRRRHDPDFVNGLLTRAARRVMTQDRTRRPFDFLIQIERLSPASGAPDSAAAATVDKGAPAGQGRRAPLAVQARMARVARRLGLESGRLVCAAVSESGLFGNARLPGLVSLVAEFAVDASFERDGTCFPVPLQIAAVQWHEPCLVRDGPSDTFSICSCGAAFGPKRARSCNWARLPTRS